ncbi:MAG: hypothetical protein N838_14475 [Thiohalocapsa sp. PB-PSB1]|jgi:hypothetical protein|nr:MAG: hypothetical protein N838_14475 [Thiohalocapsa sp. PB-PSB1]
MDEHLATGMVRAEVLEKLGQPDFASGDNSYLSYDVRFFYEKPCGFSSVAFLALHFDAEGNLISREIGFD